MLYLLIVVFIDFLGISFLIIFFKVLSVMFDFFVGLLDEEEEMCLYRNILEVFNGWVKVIFFLFLKKNICLWKLWVRRRVEFERVGLVL